MLSLSKYIPYFGGQARKGSETWLKILFEVMGERGRGSGEEERLAAIEAGMKERKIVVIPVKGPAYRRNLLRMMVDAKAGAEPAEMYVSLLDWF